jgi:alpha-D-ribose 1-methylphosphonate 5-triphosphate synthase subunit PhnG
MYTDLIVEPESENRKSRRTGMNMLKGRRGKTAHMFNYKGNGIEL